MTTEIQPNDICALLFSRGDGITWHWGLWMTNYGSSTEGTYLHVTNRDGPWDFEQTDNFKLSKDPFLVVCVRIGNLGSRAWSEVWSQAIRDRVKELIHALPMKSKVDYDVKFSCRIWFRDAARALVQEGIIECKNVDTLEAELKEYASANEDVVATGGKMKAHISKFSK